MIETKAGNFVGGTDSYSDVHRGRSTSYNIIYGSRFMLGNEILWHFHQVLMRSITQYKKGQSRLVSKSIFYRGFKLKRSYIKFLYAFHLIIIWFWGHLVSNRPLDKVGCVFAIVLLSDFRMGQHRDDDHQEDASHFIKVQVWPLLGLILISYCIKEYTVWLIHCIWYDTYGRIRQSLDLNS